MARNTDNDLRKPLQVPLLYAFREAFKAKDAKRVENVTNAGGERVLSDRGSIRRRGANEAQLKRNLEIDLINLMNSIDLESCIDIDAYDNVKRSVLNYGMPDLAHLTSDDMRAKNIIDGLKQALLRHEPRLIGSSLSVKMRSGYDAVDHKFAFDVKAEMACRPVDIPLEFVAEIDVGSGKVKLSTTNGAIGAG